MSTEWVMTRLSKQTRSALRAFADNWQAAYENGHTKVAPPASASNRMAEGPSVDQLIAELLRRDEAHRARARKQRQRGPRARRRRPAADGKGLGV